MINMLVSLLIVMLVLGIIVYIAEQMPFIPAQFKAIFRMVALVMLLIYILKTFIGVF